MSDVSDQRAAEARLRLAAGVFTHAREGIMITDTDAMIVDVNGMFTVITGFERAEVIGRSARLMRSGRQTNEFYETMWKSLEADGRWRGEIWERRKNGEVYPASMTISAVRDADVSNYVAVFSDIKEHQRQLEHFAHHDI